MRWRCREDVPGARTEPPGKKSAGLPVVHWGREETSSPGVGSVWVSGQQGMGVSGKRGRK